jgi:hypothetical protein
MSNAGHPSDLPAMLGELSPLIGAVPVAGPPVVLLAGPWLLLALVLAGPFLLVITVVIVMLAGALLIAAVVGALVAASLVPVRVIRGLGQRRPDSKSQSHVVVPRTVSVARLEHLLQEEGSDARIVA